MTVPSVIDLAQAPITKMHASHYKPNARLAIMVGSPIADNDRGSRLCCQKSQSDKGTLDTMRFVPGFQSFRVNVVIFGIR